jgi:uncharacterized RDD family membrane protein YckC
VPPSELSEPAPARAVAAPVYIGLATRAVAFVIDAVLILLVELVIGVSGVVIITVLHLPTTINAILAILGGIIYIVWSVSYFVGFWCATGQTPGARVMQFRVVTADGELMRPRRALVRCIGLLLAALPLPGPAGGNGGRAGLAVVDRRGAPRADDRSQRSAGGPRPRGLTAGEVVCATAPLRREHGCPPVLRSGSCLRQSTGLPQGWW